MKTVAGLWIDHRKAFIVTLSDKGEETKQILSNIDKQNGRTEGIRSNEPFEPFLVAADDSRQRHFTGHLDTYYKEVLESINKDVKSVLLMGPGEAKTELKKVLEKTNHRDITVAVEPADKLTDHQIAAKVRDFFKVRNII